MNEDYFEGTIGPSLFAEALSKVEKDETDTFYRVFPSGRYKEEPHEFLPLEIRHYDLDTEQIVGAWRDAEREVWEKLGHDRFTLTGVRIYFVNEFEYSARPVYQVKKVGT